MSTQHATSREDPSFDFVRELAEDLKGEEFDLPPFPDTALRVQRCVDDPYSDIQELTPIVAGEPALAARIMRLANSALLRRGPMEVTDIGTAISRIGMDMVLNVAVAFAAQEAFKFQPGRDQASVIEGLRRQNVLVATLAFLICRHFSQQCATVGKPEEAMLAGLLHNVGRLYIYSRASERVEAFTDPDDLHGLVADWHTGVARAIVDAWGFPEPIARAVDEQETVERDRLGPAELSDVLIVAIAVADVETGYDSALADADALARLGLNLEELTALLWDLDEEIRSTAATLWG